MTAAPGTGAAGDDRADDAPLGPLVGPAASGRPPTGRGVRAHARRTTRTRTGAGLGQVLGDLYTIVFSVAIGLTMAMSAAGGLAEEWHSPDAAPDAVLDPAWVAVLALVAVLGAVLSLATRLGPVALGSAEAAWWLPLPVDRRSLLRPAALRVPVVAGVGAGAVGGVLGMLAFPEPGAARILGAVATAGVVAAALVALAGLAQTARLPRRLLTRIGDGLLGAAPVVGLLLVLRPPSASTVTAGVPVALVAGAAVLAVAAGVALDVRLGRVPDAELRERGAVAGQALGAVVSLDSRELGRALTENPRHQRRRRSSRLGWVAGPASAVVTADALLLVRSPRRVAQVAVAACLPVAALLAGAWGAAALAPALLVGGYVATLATAEGSRRAETAPVLDRLVPLAAASVRRLRLLVPGVVMLGWSLVVFGALAGRTADQAWLLLGVVAAPVWGAAAVRGAYRSAPDWSGPLVASPFGALPPGVASVLARGPDVVVLGLAPVLVALAVGAVPPVVVAVQAAVSAIAVAVATHVPAATARTARLPARTG